jgi:hypothetical protein
VYFGERLLKRNLTSTTYIIAFQSYGIAESTWCCYGVLTVMRAGIVVFSSPAPSQLGLAPMPGTAVEFVALLSARVEDWERVTFGDSGCGRFFCMSSFPVAFFFYLSFLAGCSTFGLQELVTNDFCGWLHSCECASRGPTQNELGVLYWFSSSEFLSLTICVAEIFLFSFLQCVV